MRFHFEPLAENVYLSEDGSKVFIIDQTLLPNVSKVIALQTAEEIYEAIFQLRVRGAPAIGICAGYGMFVLAQQISTEDPQEFLTQFRKYKEYLNSSRPTAVNLSWALTRMEGVVTANLSRPVEEIVRLLGE